MANNKVISEREQAVIRYAIAYGIENKARLYLLAYDASADQAAQISDIPAQASRWWNSRKIREFYAREVEEYQIRQERLRANIRAEVEAELQQAIRDGRATSDGLIDYSRQDNQIKLLNRLINHADTPADQLDALKTMLAEISRRNPPEKQESPQRFYVPLRCGECPIKKLFAHIREVPEIQALPEFAAAVEKAKQTK